MSIFIPYGRWSILKVQPNLLQKYPFLYGKLRIYIFHKFLQWKNTTKFSAILAIFQCTSPQQFYPGVLSVSIFKYKFQSRKLNSRLYSFLTFIDISKKTKSRKQEYLQINSKSTLITFSLGKTPFLILMHITSNN